jgi:hypothetical protein
MSGGISMPDALAVFRMMPLMYTERKFAEEGGLVAYAPEVKIGRAATYLRTHWTAARDSRTCSTTVLTSPAVHLVR